MTGTFSTSVAKSIFSLETLRTQLFGGPVVGIISVVTENTMKVIRNATA